MFCDVMSLVDLRLNAVVSVGTVCLLTASSAKPVLWGPLNLIYCAACSTLNDWMRFLNGVKLAIFVANEELVDCAYMIICVCVQMCVVCIKKYLHVCAMFVVSVNKTEIHYYLIQSSHFPHTFSLLANACCTAE